MKVFRSILILPVSLGAAALVAPLRGETAPVAVSTAASAIPAVATAPVAGAAPEDRRVVGEVVVRGNRFNASRAVLAKTRIKTGRAVSDFQADVDRLMETDLYDDVRVSIEDLPGRDAAGALKTRVIFTVVERPILRRVDFKGNTKLPTSRFRDEVASKAGDPHIAFRVGEDERKILATYKEEGYADAKVESYTTPDPKTNKVALTFFITEGGRVVVRRVTVEGNRFYSDAKARKFLKKTRRKKVYREEDVKADLDRLAGAYKNQGFLEVAFEPPAASFNEDHSRVDVTITVKEGRRYTVGEIGFAGGTLFTSTELTKAVTLVPGRLYRQDKMDESLHNLQDLYADKGYLRAEIEPRPSTQDVSEGAGRVDYLFSIVESSVVYVDRVYVDGNTTTKDRVILREVLLKEGDVFAAGKVRRSVERLYNLGFLDEVQVDVQQPRSPDRADLVFNVTEGKPGLISAGAGYSSVDKLVGNMQLQHGNLFGLGQRLNLTWEFGRRRQNYEIGWTDPWFMNKPMSLGVDLFNTIRAQPFNNDDFAYKRRRRGAGLRLGPRLTDRLSLLHNYRFEAVRDFDIEPQHLNNADPALNLAPQKDRRSSLTNGVIYDTRDNVFDPSRGSRHAASFELVGGPLGGTIHYYHPDVSASYYFPTFWKFVLGLSARGGYLQPFPPSKDIPAAEKFLIGGVDTVRGYRFGSVGEILGGRRMLVFNAEYKFPLVQEKNRTILQGAFFADAGGSWNSRGDVTLAIGSRPRQMLSSVGFGLRIKTPVFPVRLDWAVPLNRRPGDRIEPFNFSIGSIF
jgi:outer membrane protein insertion porin family